MVLHDRSGEPAGLDVRAGAQRLGLPPDPAVLAMLSILGDVVSRLDRSGNILGAWIADAGGLTSVDRRAASRFQSAVGLNVGAMLDEQASGRVLTAIIATLDDGVPRHVEYDAHAPGGILHMVGSCAKSGDDEVLWISKDVSSESVIKRQVLGRARLEEVISTCLRSLIEVDATELASTISDCLERVGLHFGAEAMFVRRFRGRDRTEVIAEWRSGSEASSILGTEKAGVKSFPWASRQLMADPLLVVPRVGDLPLEAAIDRRSMTELDDHGFAWLRTGPPTRPSGLLGLVFWSGSMTEDVQSFEQLGRLADAIAAVVEHHEVRARLDSQHRVFEQIARSAPLPEVLDEVCRLRTVNRPELLCVAMLVDAEQELRVASAPGLDEAQRGELDRCPPIGPEFAFEDDREERWVDRSTTPGLLGPRAELLEANAVAISVLRSSRTGSVEGVLAVYDRSPHPSQPGRDQWEAAGLGASLAMIAMDRVADLTELSYRATHDPLTGLANRLAFLDRLEQALVRASAQGHLVAVLYCDLDRFKEVNDRMGHATGDHLLRLVAERLEAQVARTDTVARFGGDEFAVLLDEVRDEDSALDTARRIAESIRDVNAHDGTDVSMSIGMAVSNASADHADALIRDADMAMYRAKSGGRDRVEVFRERIRREAHDRDRIARDLADTLTAGELEVHYQPMLSLVDGSLIGFEALARWFHPRRGSISPDEFIPIAEATGLIGRLGDQVTEAALEALTHWDERLSLHINLSARQLDDPEAVGRMAAALSRWQIDPVRVAFEVTESALLSETRATAESLAALSALGVGLVLDDFGTGYASLTYLRRFPFRGIKVDRTFVAGLGKDSEDAAIVDAVVHLSESMGLALVAEGVETEAQAGILAEIGCASAQGFLYSPAVPARDVPALIERLAARSATVD